MDRDIQSGYPLLGLADLFQIVVLFFAFFCTASPPAVGVYLLPALLLQGVAILKIKETFLIKIRLISLNLQLFLQIRRILVKYLPGRFVSGIQVFRRIFFPVLFYCRIFDFLICFFFDFLFYILFDFGKKTSEKTIIIVLFVSNVFLNRAFLFSSAGALSALLIISANEPNKSLSFSSDARSNLPAFSLPVFSMEFLMFSPEAFFFLLLFLYGHLCFCFRYFDSDCETYVTLVYFDETLYYFIIKKIYLPSIFSGSVKKTTAHSAERRSLTKESIKSLYGDPLYGNTFQIVISYAAQTQWSAADNFTVDPGFFKFLHESFD